MNCLIQLFLYNWSVCKTPQERQQKEHRIKEYSEVFFRNLRDPSIKRLHVFCEDQAAFDYYSKLAEPFGDKVVFQVVGHQPTYKEFMDYCVRVFPVNEIVCIMNGDIYFRSERDHELIRSHLRPNILFALTRHEITDESHSICSLATCPFTAGGSCDTFIFQTPVHANLDLSTFNFRQNIFGAENVFMKAWHDVGYTISNPCSDIITLHLHKGRLHFERYATINTPANSIQNVRTSLP